MPNDNETRAKLSASIIYNVVESVVLGMSVCLLAWVSVTVIDQGKAVTANATLLRVNDGRLDRMEQGGTPSLRAHEQMDTERANGLAKRVEKLESAFVSMQGLPAKIEAVQGSLSRIERWMEYHNNGAGDKKL